MEALKHLPKILSLILGIVVTTGAFAQEYDDLYFTANDRKKAEKKAIEKDDSKVTYQSYANNTYSDDYSTHEVNPEYIARYQTNSDYNSENEYVDEVDENASYGQPSYSNISYFPEEYAETATGNSGTTVINNYYGTNDNRYGNNWNNPWSPRMRMHTGFGYNPWYGWNSGWSVSIGFGTGWGGSLWGYDPWYDPFYGYGGFNDPFYNAWYAWNQPYYGWGGYYGWNRWNRYNYAYNAGFYNGLYHGGYYGEGSANRRDIVRGGRYSRGNTVADRSRVSGSRGNAVAGGGSRANVTSSSSRKDYSETQNEYYRRSRTGLSNSRTTTLASNSRTSSSRNDNVSYSSRSSSGNASSVRSSNSSSSNTRRYTSSSVNTSRSSRSNSSYSNSSSNNSRSSYTPSRSSSSRSSNSSYTPSRSSSNSSRSYTPPSNSGSSNNRSSYTPSRSSSGSSGTRSSGGSRSSSSRSRGGY